jgi:hypothetical protein
LSKYDDAKPTDESDDEGQPPYIKKSLNYFLSGAELSEWLDLSFLIFIK